MVRKIVITGLGPVTPIGIGVKQFWESLSKGKSNYSEISRFKLQKWDKIRIAAQVVNFDPSKFVSKKTIKAISNINAENGGLSLYFGVAAAKLAVKDSNLDLKKENLDRIGVIMGSGAGDLNILRRGETNFVRGAFALSNVLPGIISKELNLHGVSRFVSGACATGNIFLEEGFNRIRLGDHDVMIVGGVETPIGVPNFFGTEEDRRKGQKALSMKNDRINGMIPFGKGRDGPVLSEGAGALILEEEQHAKKRGAKIYAEVLGCGNFTIFNENLVRINQKGYENAMKNSLKNAGIKKIDSKSTYVNAHGTATEMNDSLESKAICNVIGEHVPVSSFKGTLGHAQAGAPAMELIGCALVIKNDFIPPTNLKDIGKDCAKLNYVTNEINQKMKIVVKNAAGFNGVYSTIILGKYK